MDPWSSFSNFEESGLEGESEDKHLQSLGKVLDEGEATEEKIRSVRRLNEKIDNVVDLRIIF
ncbi:hypothetical protein F4678DRAFT_423138 [Xylaria arbuscula]|nr:hypothetical protein F4678DRAFT_423138 [Xylaria arbuscula]